MFPQWKLQTELTEPLIRKCDGKLAPPEKLAMPPHPVSITGLTLTTAPWPSEKPTPNEVLNPFIPIKWPKPKVNLYLLPLTAFIPPNVSLAKLEAGETSSPGKSTLAACPRH